MTDEHSTSAHQGHPQGGRKDTNDLTDVKKVPAPGMEEKAREVDQTPKRVTGELDGAQPAIRRQ
ncbi:hypothetical protein [Deinococcus yunweiensis]|uniref:hypothetical protein n=1 Tax=Deinococcus yunweiensis TaxID=367282 RepID=UPI00398E6110